ncbi:hypothetical protein F6X40_40485 [Paraburkholderia sp. UCT31]|uniref:hypothetical protein n=1 Tax=Paraburkholderia sp. UCT31 TaxID=2615209 RepID=UPI0016550F33|nr:hypothetical protein [Paraburkholderia sp. UCT31]MBC8742759.1 hypothetical protein [Paraburkholderia sp. UCT31]
MSGILSKDDYAELFRADYISAGKIARVLNDNGSANMTVCPVCRMDDFTHVEGCEMLRFVDDYLRPPCSGR